MGIAHLHHQPPLFTLIISNRCPIMTRVRSYALLQTVEIKLVRERSHVDDAAGEEKSAEGKLIAFDDDDTTATSDEGKHGKEEEAEEEDEIVIVQVPRLSFDSDKQQVYGHQPGKPCSFPSPPSLTRHWRPSFIITSQQLP
jgi:hypothetical protein